MISAASSQVIFFAMALKITSCTFIIRSHSAADIARLVSNLKRLPPLFQKRTDTVLIQPDILRANDTPSVVSCRPPIIGIDYPQGLYLAVSPVLLQRRL